MRTLISLLIAVALPLGAYAKEARIALARGIVKVKSGNTWKKARTGQILKRGDSIKTGKKGMVILVLNKGSRLKIRAKTELRLTSLGGQKVSRFDLRKGSVFAKVTKRSAGEKFRISTPTAVAGVRGTQFFVAYGDKVKQSVKKEAMLCVNEGKVEVSSLDGKSSVMLNEGEGVVVVPGQKFPKAEKLPWIKKFNWNMDETKGSVADETSLKEAYKSGYKDLLDQDYD